MARDFDGSADGIHVAGAVIDVAINTGFASGCAFNSDTTHTIAQVACIMGGATSSSAIIELLIGNGAADGEGQLLIRPTGSGLTSIDITETMDDQLWHSIVCGRTAAGVLFYSFDGGTTVTGSTQAAAFNTGEPIGIGARRRNGATFDLPFDGKVANAFFDDGVDMSAAQAQELSRLILQQQLKQGDAGLNITDGFILPLWGADDPEPDMSGLGNNGTLTSAPPQSDHLPLRPPFGYDIPVTVAPAAAPAGGRIMSSLTQHGGLAGKGGIAGVGGGLAA